MHVLALCPRESRESRGSRESMESMESRESRESRELRLQALRWLHAHSRRAAKLPARARNALEL